MFRRGYTRISRSTVHIFSRDIFIKVLFVVVFFQLFAGMELLHGTGMSLNKIELLLRNLWNLFSKVFKLEKNNTKNYILVFSEKNKDKGINVNFYLRTSSKLEPASDLLSSFLWLKKYDFFLMKSQMQKKKYLKYISKKCWWKLKLKKKLNCKCSKLTSLRCSPITSASLKKREVVLP